MRSPVKDPCRSHRAPSGNRPGPVRSPSGHPTGRLARDDGNIERAESRRNPDGADRLPGSGPTGGADVAGGPTGTGHAPPRGGRGHGATAPAKVHRASDMATRPEGATGRAKVHCGQDVATRPERFHLLGFVVSGPVNPAGKALEVIRACFHARVRDRAGSRRRLPPGVPFGCARLRWQGLLCRIGIRTGGSPFRRWPSRFRILGTS